MLRSNSIIPWPVHPERFIGTGAGIPCSISSSVENVSAEAAADLNKKRGAVKKITRSL
jgi:hypothetical protein